MIEKQGLSQEDIDFKARNNELIESGSRVESIFEVDRLLARAMDAVRIYKDTDGSLAFDYQTWDEEFSLMENNEMKYTSCTLLIPEEKIPTYKSSGFLMNGDKSEIAHVSESDSGSSGNVGDFRANSSEIENLDQLATIIRSNSSHTMNEVNAHFTIDSIEGLFVRDASSPKNKIEIFLTQRHIMGRGLSLPIYIYKDDGSIEKWEPSKGELLLYVSELRSIFTSVFRDEIEKVF